MSIATWSDQQLDELRQHGDPPADALASRLFEHPATGEQEFGRLGYNHILNLTDKMQEAPELVFANDSELYRQLHAMPPEFVDYFDPMELPSWVDPAKLVVASRMWMDNSLGMLVVLFLGSLPACYLMARGIPALYQTNKLSDPRYISQRIYETGLMLDAVMKDGGFKILTDIAGAPKDALLAALKKLDPSGAWVSEGRNLRRKSDAPQVPLSHDGILEHLSEHETKTRRFVWGPGYVTVKKVRFLHASMRYMLQHPEQFAAAAPPGAPANLAQAYAQRAEPWDSKTLGLPVNQEDLAYTLLTFGYVIPMGMERWGCKFTLEQKGAFLTCGGLSAISLESRTAS